MNIIKCEACFKKFHKMFIIKYEFKYLKIK